MKHLNLICSLLCCLFFFSCVHQSIVSNPNDIKSSWKGTFKSNYHADGEILYWNLYNDGTMSGEWLTQKGSATINVEGVYQKRSDGMSFHAKGSLLISDKIKPKISISGKGSLEAEKGYGIFHIKIDHPDYPDDNGTWHITRI